MKIAINHRSHVDATPRLMQITASMDVAEPATSEFTATVDLDIDTRPWKIGAIVGPSGSGKTSLAHHVWPGQLTATPHWPDNTAVADAFPTTMTASDVTELLGRVGLSSVPTWQRPYHVLSNGERFRADMARLIAADDPIVVVDEFTSLVDRTVAKATSHAVQKAIRARSDRQLVAVTCHYDILDWLQPDWVVDMATRQFSWRSVQPRPNLQLDIFQGTRADWRAFSPHHYLSATLPNPTARHIYVGDIEGTPAVFCALAKFPHPSTKNLFMVSRLVTSPDFQGFGLGIRLAEWVGQRYAERGYRVRIPTSHPALVHSLARSPRWAAATKLGRNSARSSTSSYGGGSSAAWRRFRIATFQYMPPRTG